MSKMDKSSRKQLFNDMVTVGIELLPSRINKSRVAEVVSEMLHSREIEVIAAAAVVGLAIASAVDNDSLDTLAAML
jgi:hypothetical protein